mgnify:CR=1 FL=1|tara:strand:+ start:215 stop:1180 length:966 start_codon:yes stop_codon:yes gene_type:complete
MKKKIIIVIGDPISINSEILFKTWKKIDNFLKKKIIVISNFDLLQEQFKKLNYSLKMLKIKNIRENTPPNVLKVLDVKLKYISPFKIKKRDLSKFIINSLTLAHNLSLKDEVIGMINCPISKKNFIAANIGVTEYLASKCKIKNNSEVMLIKSNNLTVCPVTTHLDIKQISKKLNKSLIINKIKTIYQWYKKKENFRPKIGILGLNPHNAELRKNSEENKYIIPSIKILKKLKINVEGPLVSDSFFIEQYKNYDVVVGMYHDQVLIPIKTLFKYEAINVTLGLKYLRVSPDHGVASNLINKNKANPTSLIKCIKFINKFRK